ncbi:cupredoxin family copper-binding protein [Arthrobacter humicola]|uniref:Cupredoxin family copper-binding protein n=1 Tax=Arthrobacter humicola TaxID=409291 RepID=A0ABN2ZN55_9MICC
MKAGRKLSSLWVVLILVGTGGCAGGGGMPATTSAPASGSSSGASPTAATATGTITIKDFAFGDPLTVAPGATVAITNMDTAAHTVTADEGTAFDTEVKGGGGTATFTAPTKPGSYPYHCTFHPGMHGVLIVK